MNQAVIDKINAFFAQYPERRYPKGQILLFANDNPGKIFYLVEGRVRMYDISYRGDEVIVNLFGDNSFFPMANALTGDANKFFYATETPALIRVASATDVRTFLDENPDVALDLLTRVYRGVDGLLGRVVHLMSGTARSRVIYELVTETRRFGTPANDAHSFTLDLREVDLAARCGLSRETVSREIHRLKEKGMISLAANTILVHNLFKLEQLLPEKK